MVQTAMTGLQTAAATLTTSALNAVTYNRTDGFGWSNDIFKAGMNGMFTNTLSSMANTFTSGTLQAINSGMSIEKLEGFNNGNKSDITRFNNLAGALAGQGVNYAMGSDFTLNVFNLSMMTDEQYNGGLLELHLGRNDVSMSLGTGGANVSFDNLQAVVRGAQVWNVNNRINSFTRNNKDFDSSITLRAQYGYGSDIQKSQLWDILKGGTKIMTDTEGDFFAETTIVDGQRMINLSGYQMGMSLENQMRLAVILGQEAYRDGYVTGETDAYGNVVTAERAFFELTEASIARIAMGNRINMEYDWFYDYNMDFEFESYLLDMAKTSGDFSLFNDYLELVYNNEKDYFFQQTATGGNFQNVDEFKTIPLFNAISEEKAKEKDKQRQQTAYDKYTAKMKEEGNANPLTLEAFIKDKDLSKAYEYNEFKFESIRLVGCRFLSTKYGLEAITGLHFDTLSLHNYITQTKLYSNESDLSSQNMADIMTRRSEGEYNVTVLYISDELSVEKLYELQQSSQMYLACLQVGSASGGVHYVMLSSIDFTYDENEKVTGIDKVNVANPWNQNDYYTGNQSYTMSEIFNWDIFKVTPNWGYSQKMKYQAPVKGRYTK
jgi:hypothetical protein